MTEQDHCTDDELQLECDRIDEAAFGPILTKLREINERASLDEITGQQRLRLHQDLLGEDFPDVEVLQLLPLWGVAESANENDLPVE